MSVELTQIRVPGHSPLHPGQTLDRMGGSGGYNNSMSHANRPFEGPLPTRLYRGPSISRSVIRRYARQVAERFQPDKIILFGSHAYGRPHTDSDVDLLVIMPARNPLDQAVRIRWELPAPFPMDLLVRTPKTVQWRLAEGDSFLAEIMTKGKILYEKAHQRVGAKSRSRSRHGKRTQPAGYPSSWTNKRRARAALRWADRVRTAARSLLGIGTRSSR